MSMRKRRDPGSGWRSRQAPAPSLPRNQAEARQRPTKIQLFFIGHPRQNFERTAGWRLRRIRPGTLTGVPAIGGHGRHRALRQRQSGKGKSQDRSQGNGSDHETDTLPRQPGGSDYMISLSSRTGTLEPPSLRFRSSARITASARSRMDRRRRRLSLRKRR